MYLQIVCECHTPAHHIQDVTSNLTINQLTIAVSISIIYLEIVQYLFTFFSFPCITGGHDGLVPTDLQLIERATKKDFSLFGDVDGQVSGTEYMFSITRVAANGTQRKSDTITVFRGKFEAVPSKMYSVNTYYVSLFHYT